MGAAKRATEVSVSGRTISQGRKSAGRSEAAARHQANERNYPQGPAGPTPADRWNARLPIQDSQREQFQDTIQQHPAQIIANWQRHFDEKNRNHQKQVFRQATRRALLDLGLLTITRRSIPLPLKRKKGG